MLHLPAYGAQGMVAAGHPLAAVIGLEALRSGGTAVDAAVAAAAAEWVLLPHLCGPGGDAFALVRPAGAPHPMALLGSGAAPDGMTPEWFLERGQTSLPLEGPHSIAVPGAVGALGDLWRRWGTRDWEGLLAPAVSLAADGVAANSRVVRGFAAAAAKAARFPGTARIYYPHGQPPGPGRRLVQPELARSLGRLAQAGPDDFYRGQLADAILGALFKAGGFFSGGEWAAHRTEVAEPVAAGYRGLTVYSPPPPSQGILLLQCLKLIEGFPVGDWAPDSGRLIHLLAEAKKRAFADRLAYLGDPRCTDFDPRRLLTDAYAAARRAGLDTGPAAAAAPPGAPPEADSNTSFLCTADAAGNAVAWIHSLSGRTFGSAWVAGDTGIVMNSRAGRGFTLEPGHPNRLTPGKRTMHTLGAWMAFCGGQPVWIGGTPGGDQQPQWNLQTLVRLLDHGLDPASAATAPRWASFPGTDPEHQGKPFVLRLEEGFPPETLADLAARGHRLEPQGRWSGGGAVQVIGWQPGGVLVAGSDPRAGGGALGW